MSYFHTAGSGAIVTFHGTTRDVDRFDYEASEPIEAILTAVAAKHEGEGEESDWVEGTPPTGLTPSPASVSPRWDL